MSDVGTFGYGQLTPEDFGADANAVAFVARQLIAQITTMKLVTVVAIHPGTGSPPVAGTVDVQPLVNQIDGNGFAVPHGTVFGLQYLRLQAGPWAIIADPAVGDMGIIVCADRDSSSVTRSGQQSAPASRRRYNIADGIYIGGILGGTPQAYIQVNSDGSLNITDQFGNVLKTSSSGFALTGNVTVTGTISATGTIIAGKSGVDQVGLQTHTHTANNTPPTAGT